MTREKSLYFPSLFSLSNNLLLLSFSLSLLFSWWTIISHHIPNPPLFSLSKRKKGQHTHTHRHIKKRQEKKDHSPSSFFLLLFSPLFFSFFSQTIRSRKKKREKKTDSKFLSPTVTKQEEGKVLPYLYIYLSILGLGLLRGPWGGLEEERRKRERGQQTLLFPCLLLSLLPSFSSPSLLLLFSPTGMIRNVELLDGYILLVSRREL